MKISKDSYSDYIESQLNKFAAFIAQSPSNSNRINHIEDVIDHLQTKISQLESNLKLQTICLNQHMNLMYRNKNNSEYIKQISKGFLSKYDSSIQQNQRCIELVSMNDKYEDLSQRITRVQQGLQNHISKSKRVSKQIKERNNIKKSNQQCIQIFTDNYDLNERIEQICINKYEQVISSVLNTQLQTFKQQFEQQKKLIKKSLNKKLQHFLSRINETISDSYNSVDRSNSVQLHSPNVIEQLKFQSKFSKLQKQYVKQSNKQNQNHNIFYDKNQINNKQLDTIKIKNNFKSRKQNKIIKEFKQQTERAKIQINPKIQRKNIKSRSKSISQLSNKSDIKSHKQIKQKRSKSKQKENKQILMNPLKRQQSINRIHKLKSKKNLKQLRKQINNKNDIMGTQYSIKNQKKSNKNSRQLSRSVSQSKIKSKIISKLDQKLKNKRHKKDKDHKENNKSVSKSISLSKSKSKSKSKYQKKSIDLSNKSNSVSLLSIDSCSRSHSNISKISAKQKKNKQKAKRLRESPPQFNTNSKINQKNEKKKSLNTNRTNK